MSIKNSPSCPSCGQIDAVQSVTAIIQSGITTTNYQTAYNQNRTAESVSFLAKRLMFPFKKPLSFGASLALIFGTAFLSMCVTLPLMSGSGSNGLAYYSVVVCSGLFTLIFLIFGVVYLITGKQNNDQQHETYNRALRKWQQLYYCHRDDVLFMPGENRTVNPEQLRSYLAH
ncbi:MAG: hypothetical protein QY306_07975 [Anaerolineales bacterium]|nr:MAG: hypothetical protein QY306_07975 [Anaerolineales bacterium]